MSHSVASEESASGPAGPDEEQGGVSARLVGGLWTGLALFAARLGVLWAMDQIAHGNEWSRVRLRVAASLTSTMIASMFLGVVAAFLIGAALRGRRLRDAQPFVAVMMLAAAATAYLAGWAGGDASRSVGTETTRGVATGAGVAVVAFVLMAALAVRLARGSASLGARGFLAPLLLAVVVVFGGRAVLGQVEESMVIREVAVSPFSEGSLIQLPRSLEIEILEQPEEAPGLYGVITPSLDFKRLGADMPSLVLPPQSSVLLKPSVDLGSTVLHMRAGVDHSVMRDHGEALAGAVVRFVVALGGRNVFSEDIVLAANGERPDSEWIAVGGVDGLAIEPGQPVMLRTSWRSPPGRDDPPPPGLMCGFGGVTFERVSVVPRRLSSPEQPNIIVIVMDTQRADRLSAYGYGRPTSPNLEVLAANGLTFDAAYSTASWTWPSTASLLTGLLPEEHGVLDSSSCWLGDGLQTLPEVLQREGYSTAAWSANVLIVPDKNFDQGFETFDHSRGSTRESDTFMPAALEWIDSMAGTRFFLYLQLLDAHSPHLPLPEGRALLAADVPADLPPYLIADYNKRFRAGEGHDAQGNSIVDQVVPADHRRWLSDLYDACTWSGDYWLGQVMDRLVRNGIEGETILVFTSDHGEELFEHGMVTHGQAIHREGVHVPLVMAGPGIPRGLRSNVPVSNRHLAPTLARRGGASFELSMHSWDYGSGADLLELATTPPSPEPVLYSTRTGWWNGRMGNTLLGVRLGDLVLHWATTGRPWGADATAGPGDGEWRLFDLAQDPGELLDIAAEQPEAAAHLRGLLKQRLVNGRSLGPSLGAGDAMLEQLQQLGYIDADAGADADQDG